LNIKGKNENVIYSHRNISDLRKDPFSASGAFLVPFVGRIPEGYYVFDGVRYEFEEKNVKHGLLYDRKWTIKSVDEKFGRVIFSYRIKEDEFESYPFDLSIDVEFSLSIKGLKVVTFFKNTGSKSLPLSFGWHPYFRLFDEDIDKYVLKIPAEKIIVLDDVRKIPTGVEERVRGSCYDFSYGKKIKEIVMDTVFSGIVFDGDKAFTYLTCCGSGVKIWQTYPYKYIVVYTPAHRKSIAIEPWSSAPNSYNMHRLGLIRLAPNQTITASFGVQKYSSLR